MKGGRWTGIPRREKQLKKKERERGEKVTMFFLVLLKPLPPRF